MSEKYRKCWSNASLTRRAASDVFPELQPRCCKWSNKEKNTKCQHALLIIPNNYYWARKRISTFSPEQVQNIIKESHSSLGLYKVYRCTVQVLCFRVTFLHERSQNNKSGLKRLEVNRKKERRYSNSSDCLYLHESELWLVSGWWFCAQHGDVPH